jgi:hypothetical protein
MSERHFGIPHPPISIVRQRRARRVRICISAFVLGLVFYYAVIPAFEWVVRYAAS